ncbi:MAG: RNA polymerase factor sigma-54 [Bacteroidota bacterium]
MLKQSLQLKLQQRLSPQQIQLMKMLQIPTMELEQRIKDEMEVNPALEEGGETKEEETSEEDEYEEDGNAEGEDFDLTDYFSDDEVPDYKLHVNNASPDQEDRDIPIRSGKSFHEQLYSQIQLRELDEHEQFLAEYLIGNLDDNGYLRRELQAVVNDLAFSLNVQSSVQELENILQEIQELDPAGVGARDLRECLIIQIKRIENKSAHTALALEIIEKHFEEFTKKHYEKIAKKISISDQELKPAIDLILHLNPKPGDSMQDSSRTVQHIIPDFMLFVENDEFKLQLNGRNAPELRISKEYKGMLEHYSKLKSKDQKSKEAVQFVKQKIDSAKWFIDAIQQRNNTLMTCMETIVNFQKEFFLSGDETKLKPMILKDIADLLNMDISTISRVANSKYIQTPYGTYLLKYFFAESLSTDEGEEVSSREVKQILRDAISAENKRKPLTDEKLGKLLNEKGYNIARRTVAKYREQLGIPVARLRKEL